jgi:hypothetical protein
MNPALILVLALILPIVMMILLAGPVYAGGYAGLILLYGDEISKTALQPDFMIDTYEGLFKYWQVNQASVGFVEFVLPAFGPIAVGIGSGIVFFVMFIRYLRNVFVL